MMNKNWKKPSSFGWGVIRSTSQSKKFMPIIFTNSVLYKETQRPITMTKYWTLFRKYWLLTQAGIQEHISKCTLWKCVFYRVNVCHIWLDIHIKGGGLNQCGWHFRHRSQTHAKRTTLQRLCDQAEKIALTAPTDPTWTETDPISKTLWAFSYINHLSLLQSWEKNLYK